MKGSAGRGEVNKRTEVGKDKEQVDEWTEIF